MFLSIIIPCYRETQAQLNRCLDSLLFLTPLCEWEVWIIDDGSPCLDEETSANEQSCGPIEAWVKARQDEHMHVIRQTNQGQGAARNVGLEHATGQYVAFLDADDEWMATPMTSLISLLQAEQPDLLGLRYKPTRQPYYDGDTVRFMSEGDIVPAVCGYIIRREWLGALRFTPGIYHEDEEFNTRLHLRHGRLILTPIVAYRYNINAGSTIQSKDHAHLNKRFDDLLGIIARLKDNLAHLDTTARLALNRRIHVLAMSFIVNLLRDAPSRTFISDKLARLSAMGLYPLPPFRGIRRYGWIRPLTSRQWLIKMEWMLMHLH